MTASIGRLRRWGPALAMMALIFLASSIPSTHLPTTDAWDALVKKGGHVLGYALLGLAYLHGLSRGRPASGARLLWAVALAALYGVTDELHQLATPGRMASAWDVALDAGGAALGVGLWAGWRGRAAKDNG